MLYLKRKIKYDDARIEIQNDSLGFACFSLYKDNGEYYSFYQSFSIIDSNLVFDTIAALEEEYHLENKIDDCYYILYSWYNIKREFLIRPNKSMIEVFYTKGGNSNLNICKNCCFDIKYDDVSSILTLCQSI